MSESNAQSGGIGVFGLLLVIFITLKVLAIEPVASWSWIWVLSPMWIAAALGLSIFLIVICVALIGEWFTRRRAMRQFED